MTEDAMQGFLFVSLAFVTFQVLMLRRVLVSIAWTLIAAGFVVFAVLLGIQLLEPLAVPVRLTISLIGYGLVATGFHLLRRDLYRVLGRRVL